MNGCQLVVAVSVFACFLAQKLNAQEIAILAAVLTQLGDTLATITVQEEICEGAKETAEECPTPSSTSPSPSPISPDQKQSPFPPI